MTTARPDSSTARDDPLVLLAERLAGVDHDDRHLGALHRAGGAQRRVVLVSARVLDPSPDPGGVDELPGPTAELDQLVDRVDRRAGRVVHDDPLLAGELVQQARLADVGLADDGDPARTARAFVDVVRRYRQRRQDGVEQVAAAPAVQRRDGYGSPRPRFHSRAASASARWSSTLLAARITGLPDCGAGS